MKNLGSVGSHNDSMQRTGAGRSAPTVIVARWRLAPVADAVRSL